MKKFNSLLLLITAVGLTGCNTERGASYNEMKAEPAPVMAQADYAESDQLRGGATAPKEVGDNPTSQSFLAYRYNYTFALPVKSVKPTMQSHMQTCLQAGPDMCQVLSSNSSASDQGDYANAYLRLRAEPEWLKSYRDGLEASVKDAKGLITNSGVSAEDLTRSILDTDARLKAQKTLRTRLEGLLETRDAKLSDLLALERELARVQGEIESATTTLNVLRKRVSMSIVDINYQTKQVAVSSGALSPIGEALTSFVGEFSEGLGAVIEFLARFLPWLIFVILPLIWVFRWFWRRTRQKDKPKPKIKAAPPANT